MRTHLHRWLPTVLALIALVFALDLPSHAAAKINGKNIKKGTVAAKQVKNQNLTGRDIKNESLSGAELRDGTVAAADLAACGAGDRRGQRQTRT